MFEFENFLISVRPTETVLGTLLLSGVLEHPVQGTGIPYLLRVWVISCKIINVLNRRSYIRSLCLKLKLYEQTYVLFQLEIAHTILPKNFYLQKFDITDCGQKKILSAQHKNGWKANQGQLLPPCSILNLRAWKFSACLFRSLTKGDKITDVPAWPNAVALR